MTTYDDAVNSVITSDTASNARFNYMNNYGTNPDAVAEAQRVAKRTGVPVDTAMNVPDVKKQDAIGGIDFDNLAKVAPATAGVLADMQKSRIALDDVENMGTMEALVNSFKRGVPALKSILPTIQATNSAYGLQMFNDIDARIDKGEDVKTVLSDYASSGMAPLPWMTSDQALASYRKLKAGAVANLQSTANENINEVVDLQKERAAIPQPASVGRMMNAKTWGDAFSAFGEQPITNIASIGPESLMQSLPGLLAAIPAGIAAGPAGVAAAMGTNSFIADFAGTLQSALQDHGIDLTDRAAVTAAMSNPEILADITRQAGQHASVVAGFDALSGGLAGKTLLTKGMVSSLGAHTFKKELANIGVQAPVQATLGMTGEALGELNAGQELQPGQILAEGVGEFFGTPSEVVSASAGRLRENFSKVKQAEQGAQTVANINDAAKASKVLARDPDTFEQFIADAAQNGPLDHVYIDANALMQSGVAQDVAAVSPSVSEQLQSAVQTGGTIAIPIEEYTARIAPTEYSQQLLDHIRTEPEGFSRAEAQEYMQTTDERLQKDVEKILTEKQGDTVFKQSADNVRAIFKDQLDTAGRFTSQVNDVYSNLVGNFYAVQAARLGITPEEMYQQFPLNIQAESIVGSDQFNQSPAVGTPEFQNWFGDSKAVTKDGKPLVMYHGTKADFDSFDSTLANSSSKTGVPEGALFFSDKPDVASSYTVKHQGDFSTSHFDGGNVMPVYLSIKKPLKVNAKGENWREILFKGEYRTINEIVEEAKASGKYDGVIVNKIRDKGKGDVSSKTASTYVVFSPEQIKSATGNNGQFNPNDPNILRQDQAPVASVKGDELGELTPDNVIEKAHQWYRQNLQEKTINRPGVGDIRFSGKGWKKLKRGLPTDLDKARLIMAIPDIIEKGEYSGRTPLYKERSDDIVAFHYFVAPVELNGETVQVGVSVGEDSFGNLFYNLNKDPEALQEKQKTHLLPRLEARGDESLVDGETTYKQSVPENSDDINIDILDRAYKQQARGAFNPHTYTISLLKNADLSTFLHESGHFFLEVLNDLASRENAPQGIKDDMATVLKDFGIKDMATWNAMSMDEKRPFHEKFARGFERYLFEGKAPSIEMQGIFQRFRAWMLNVYKKISALDVQLSDDVRSVFDRMLASTEEIQLAEQSRSMSPLFQNEEQAGMSPIEFQDYQRLGVDATNEAIEDLQSKGLRDMQWLRNARGRELSRLQKEAKERRAEVREEVSAEVMQEPIYQAWQFLKNKKDGDKPAGKLSTPALQETYGGNGDQYAMLDWKRLRDQRMVAEDGINPDVVAEQFGFSSGDELVRKLLQAEMPVDIIEARTDTRMLERYAELSSPEALQREADKAIHNDVRARMVATEANALAKAVGQRRILASAAKAYARAMIDRLKIRSIKPGQYANAEMRASSNAESAMRRGDLTTAAAEKRNQLVQQYAVRAAYDAQDEVDSGVRYLNKFNKLVSTIDIDYREQIEALLERFDLRKSTSLSDIDKRKTLVQWMESQRDVGLEPDIPNALQNEAYRKSYKDMTLEEFRGLVESVKQIEHLGRLKKRLLTARNNKEFEAIRDELADSILANSQNRKANTRTPSTNLGRFVGSIKAFGAAHIKAATWAHIMDGNKDGGAMWEYFVRSANERAAHEATMRADATKKLMGIMEPVLKDKMGGKGTYFPSIDRSLNKESVLAMALNMGNEGNVQRLLGGENWTVQQITPVLQTLTSADWKAVQEIWDHFETYRPLIAEKERRVFGKEPDWIEPQPFNIDTADGQTVSVKGGYYPIQYDSRASIRAEEHADAQEAKDAMLGAYNATTTRRSFTKSRAEEVIGRPLLLTSSGIYKGLNEVIHDLSWHEWLIDTNRLLKSEKLDRAIRSTYGPDVVNQFKTWRDDIATEASKTNNAVESAIQLVRQNVSMTGLGYNILAAIQQPIGLTQSIVRVGLPWITKGVGQYLSNPFAKTKEVQEKSEFMANRSRTRFRELNELKNKVQGKNSVREAIVGHAFTLMAKVQSTVDIPTWAGAYEKAISEGADESKAIAIADQAVIDSQGDGAINSLSAVERGGPATKLFTVFYSYMNTALNLLVNSGMSERNAAQKAADFLMLTIIPTSLTVLLKSALVPSGGGDDDNKKLMQDLLKENIEFFFGLFVLGREVASAGSTMAGVGDKFGYQGPAGLRPVSDTIDFAKALDKSIEKGEPTKALVRTTTNIIGGATGLPSAQINRTITGVKALHDGDTKNPLAIGFGFNKEK